MRDLQSAWDWVVAHTEAFLYVARAHWHAAIERLAPALQAVIEWSNAHLRAAIAATGAALHAARAFVQPFLDAVLGFLAAYWPHLSIIAVAAVVVVAAGVALFRWMAGRRRIKASLIEATLDRDPQTAWLNLAIVVRNFQPHALVVRSLQVLQPADTKVCERWKAWEPAGGSAKFIAPDLELTNAAAIERTIPPHGSGKKHELGGAASRRDADEGELKRSFYLSPPSSAPSVKLRAVLVCELQTRYARPQHLEFQRTLVVATSDPAEPASPS